MLIHNIIFLYYSKRRIRCMVFFKIVGYGIKKGSPTFFEGKTPDIGDL